MFVAPLVLVISHLTENRLLGVKVFEGQKLELKPFECSEVLLSLIRYPELSQSMTPDCLSTQLCLAAIAFQNAEDSVTKLLVSYVLPKGLHSCGEVLEANQAAPQNEN